MLAQTLTLATEMVPLKTVVVAPTGMKKDLMCQVLHILNNARTRILTGEIDHFPSLSG